MSGTNGVHDNLPLVRYSVNCIDKRLTDVENVVKQLVQDFYDGGNVPDDINPAFFVPTGQLEQENRGLKSQVEHLRTLRREDERVLALAKNRVTELENLLAERDTTIRQQKDQITNLSVDLDDFVRENDNLCEANGNLLEERDNAVAQLRNVRAALL